MLIAVVPKVLEAVTVIVLPLIEAVKPDGREDVIELLLNIPLLSVRLPL